MIKYISILLLGLAMAYWWNFSEYTVQPGIAKVASQEVKAAIYRMGPGHCYRILADGRLQVHVANKWLYLKTK